MFELSRKETIKTAASGQCICINLFWINFVLATKKRMKESNHNYHNIMIRNEQMLFSGSSGSKNSSNFLFVEILKISTKSICRIKTFGQFQGHTWPFFHFIYICQFVHQQRLHRGSQNLTKMTQNLPGGKIGPSLHLFFFGKMAIIQFGKTLAEQKVIYLFENLTSKVMWGKKLILIHSSSK